MFQVLVVEIVIEMFPLLLQVTIRERRKLVLTVREVSCCDCKIVLQAGT
jgi:hypothetical protein